MSLEDTLAPYVELWKLAPDGAAFETDSSILRPVRMNGRAAMLKLIKFADEENGPTALEYFAGDGAVALLARMGWAQVTECASGGRTLIELVHADDDAALAILCDVLAQLHAPREASAPPTLIPLRRRFRTLFRSRGQSSVFEQSAELAERLLAAPQDERVLHGDMHHWNVVWDAARGWLAIDPKGVFGERTYDYANALLNPSRDLLVLSPGRLERQVRIVAERARIESRRVLEFVCAHAGLSAAWTAEDGGDPALGVEVAKHAHAVLSAWPIR